MLDEFGLRRALECHFEQFTRLTGVIVRAAFAGLDDQRFAVELETTAYRVVQESLTNVARHSGVAEAHVHVVIDEDMLVRVADRGVGFAAKPGVAGAGLTGMQERVALVGGRFELHSAHGRGTTVVAELPLEPPMNQP
jgi:signal transduction histidine kinase